jgi:anti-sigma regulatory factor (Ser/Thr protein kinase)
VPARRNGAAVRRFILENVSTHPTDIARRAASHFHITRQAVHKHLSRLIEEGALTESGATRSRSYKLALQAQWDRTYPLEAGLAEDVVWRRDIRPVLGQLPDNVLNIWQHGITKMFNNAVDHSEGTHIRVEIRSTAADTEILVADDGIGIFSKIRDRMGLLDERHVILELSTGKLTTDPTRHTGEGIFFTSRMFDSFDVISGDVSFAHTSGEDYDFSRTVVPVVLAQYAQDPLISRSQAKRVVARVELFRTVVFDFTGVASIGQAFADEIFRVFALAHPVIELLFIHANAEVRRMIARARSSGVPERGSGERGRGGGGARKKKST